jgi:hypothetical protein
MPFVCPCHRDFPRAVRVKIERDGPLVGVPAVYRAAGSVAIARLCQSVSIRRSEKTIRLDGKLLIWLPKRMTISKGDQAIETEECQWGSCQSRVVGAKGRSNLTRADGLK